MLIYDQKLQRAKFTMDNKILLLKQWIIFTDDIQKLFSDRKSLWNIILLNTMSCMRALNCNA